MKQKNYILFKYIMPSLSLQAICRSIVDSVAEVQAADLYGQ